MSKILFLLTGTTSGLGHELEKLFVKEKIDYITINRNDVDLSNTEDVDEFISGLRQKIFSKYHDFKIVFINNAATISKPRPLNLYESRDIIKSINTNLLSPMLLLNLLSSIENKWMVFNITSGAATTYNKFLGLYSTAKLAFENYIKFIDLEAEEINCLWTFNYNPGTMKTSMHNDLKTNIFFKNKKFDKAIPKDVKIVADEVWALLKKMVNND
tara:strand:+ start:1164 stop:1805 length:642 start_codon:yes stop_codon:yes gene_type:complete